MPIPPSDPPPAAWDVLVVLVDSLDVEVPGPAGRIRHHVSMYADDRALIRREVAAFARRVAAGTRRALLIRPRIITSPGPITSLAGPGPFWIAPDDVASLLPAGESLQTVDTLMAFVKIGENRGPAVPVRHLGGALGGDRCPGGACFAGVTFRPRWIDGTGTVALHEWLHGLRWALTEVSGFPENALPDPDDGRRGPTCCTDAPSGDGPFADHVLTRHLTPEMLRAADARRGPAVDDGYVRAWTVAGAPRTGAWRTVTLPRDARSAQASLPEGSRALEIFTDLPVRVRIDDGVATTVSGNATIPASRGRVSVERALPASEIRFRVRVLR